MNGADHYRRAEELVLAAESANAPHATAGPAAVAAFIEQRTATLLAAQVHVDLAKVAAAVDPWLMATLTGASGHNPAPDDWFEALGRLPNQDVPDSARGLSSVPDKPE